MWRRTRIVTSSLAAVQAVRFLSQERSDTHTLSTAFQQFLTFDLMHLASWLARRQHDKDCASFADVQSGLLRTRLEANVSTSYGVDHGFSDLLSKASKSSDALVDAFRSQLPLTRPEDYVSYVDRVANGEASVINAEPETMLAATSGTSGRRNLLPNTPTMSSTFFSRGILVVFDTLRRTCPEAFSLQRTCKLAFAPSWTFSVGGLRIGPNSSGPKDKSFKRLWPFRCISTF